MRSKTQLSFFFPFALALPFAAFLAGCSNASPEDGREAAPSVSQTIASLETVTVVATGLRNVNGIAVDDTSVYWIEDDNAGATGTGNVSKAPLRGGIVANIATRQSPTKMVIDGSDIYWANQDATASILKAPLSGGAPQTLLGGAPYFVTSLALSGSRIHWATVAPSLTAPDLWQMGKDGSAITGLPGSGGLPTESLTWADGVLFASNGGEIQYYDTKREFLFIVYPVPQEGNPGIAHVGNTLYFMGGTTSGTTAIFSGPASTTPGTPTILDSGAHGTAPWGSTLASDGAAVYWTVCAPGTAPTACKLLRNKAGVTSTLATHKSSNGVVALSCESVYWGVDGEILKVAK